MNFFSSRSNSSKYNSLLIDMTAEPIAFVSFPSAVYEARENFKVLGWCSRHRYDLI